MYNVTQFENLNNIIEKKKKRYKRKIKEKDEEKESHSIKYSALEVRTRMAHNPTRPGQPGKAGQGRVVEQRDYLALG